MSDGFSPLVTGPVPVGNGHHPGNGNGRQPVDGNGLYAANGNGNGQHPPGGAPLGRPQLSADRGPRGRAGLADAVAAEWIKFRTVRSTLWTIGALVGLTLLTAFLSTWFTAQNYAKSGLAGALLFDPVSLSLNGVFLAVFVVGVLGTLVVSSEYGTGAIRSTLTAVPVRPRVLIAKTIVFGTAILVVGEATVFGSFFLGQSVLHGSAPTVTLSDPQVFRAVFGSGIALVLLGLIAMGLATLVRHTAGTITVYVVVLLVLPVVTQVFPVGIRTAIFRWFPYTIVQIMVTTKENPTVLALHAFSPWAGVEVLALYAVVLLGVGGIILQRRDA